MLAELIDPTVEPIPADWEVFRKQEGLPATWHAGALTAIAWCSTRPVHLGLVRDGGRVAALFLGEVGGPSRRRGVYATAGRPPVAGWFDCRLLCGFTAGFAFAAQLGDRGRRAAVGAFERAVRHRLGRRCPGVVYRQVTDEHMPAVAGRFRPRLTTAPNTLLVNRWSEPAEYFADLPRDLRRRLRRIHTEAAAATRPLNGAGAIEPLQASLLAHRTLHKHGDVRPPIPTGYFRRLNDEDGVRYFGHRDGESLLCYDLAFDDGTRLVTTVHGSLDVRDGGRRDLYFDLYLQEITYMIENGREGIEFGKGMAALKQRFGCTLIPQTLVVAAW